MYCSACETNLQPEARFCTRCGSRQRSPSIAQEPLHAEQFKIDSICASLISELDSARLGWLSLVKDSTRSSEGVSSIVNSEFSETIDIGVLGYDKPKMFVFEALNGATAEATVIGWQVESAVGFAVNQDQGYIQQEAIWKLLLGLTQSAPNNTWILALGMVVESLQQGAMIDNDCVATVLSHYFMNENILTLDVVLISEKIVPLLTFLQGFTYLGTSRVFGDLQTVARMRKTLGV
jgi:hypothetical protein